MKARQNVAPDVTKKEHTAGQESPAGEGRTLPTWWRGAALGGTALLGVALLAVLVLTSVTARPGSKAWSYQLDMVVRHGLAMVLVATAVGVATVLFQTVTSNRILTPSLMGFDAIFILIQTLLVFFAPGLQAAAATSLAGFFLETGLMVAVSVALYFWLIAGVRTTVHTLLLVGIVCGIFARSIASFFQRLLDPNSYLQLQDAMFASFRTVGADVLWACGGIIAVGLIVLAVLGTRLDVMLLGRDPAISLGVNHKAVTLTVLVVVSLMVAASTALIGPVMFFGLLVAHGAYQLMRTSRHRYTLPAAALLGVIALAGGELILRQLQMESALSVIVELAGGALLLYLLIARKGA